MRSPHVTITIDFERIAANAAAIRERTGVGVIAVLKADAYGLGAAGVARALADVVDGFYVMSLPEAVDAQLWQTTGKPTIALNAERLLDADAFREHHVRPAVWDVEAAGALKSARPILSVDTGMQRFACPVEQISDVARAGECDEAFTHATRLSHVEQFVAATGGMFLRRHAAGSALLDDPAAWLDAVRPGIALYHDAVRVTTNLIDARDTTSPVGYGGFTTPRIGVILAGYAHGIRPGPCLVNHRSATIVEVGMQSSYVAIDSRDRAGDPVTLLGEGVALSTIASAQHCSRQDVLLRLCSAGARTGLDP